MRFRPWAPGHRRAFGLGGAQGSAQAATALPDPAHDDVVDALVSVADDAVRVAMARGADAAECFTQVGTGASMSIEKNAVGFTSTDGEGGLALRVIKDRRVGFAYYTAPDDTAEAAVQALDVAARAAPGDFMFPGKGSYPSVAGLFDDRFLGMTTEDLLGAIRGLISGARDVHPGVTVAGGSVGHGVGASAVVNSEGCVVAERGSGMGLSAYVVLKDGSQVATGWKGHEANTFDARLADPTAIGCEAASQAKDSLGAIPFGDGEQTTVVFHPDATSALIEFITLPALFGDQAARGESVYSGRLGQPVVDARLALVEDPTKPHGLGSGCADDEGLPSRRVPLIEGGKVASFLYDLGSAFEYGGGADAATASAARYGRLGDDRTYKDPPSCSGRNVHLGASNACALDDLIAGIDEGILVHDVLGAHTANPTSGDFSVSSTVLFRIRKGALEDAIEPVMLAGNLPSLLDGSFVGCSTETEQKTGHFSPVGLTVPWFALRDIHVVGS